jgi:hypothetical protein
VETLQLLPPLVTAQDVRTFLSEALRAPIFDTRVIREISKSRNDHLARKLMLLQAKKVKVTDSRMYVCRLLGQVTLTLDCVMNRCPQCNKRLGNSVIAVHTPRYDSLIALSSLLKTDLDYNVEEKSRIINAEKHFHID